MPLEIETFDLWTLISRFRDALTDSYAYDFHRNPFLWFGFFWGIPIPVGFLLFDYLQSAHTVWYLFYQHPIHLFFLLHPLAFAVFFGAMGNLLRKREARLEKQATRDNLTDLKNRTYFKKEAERRILESQRYGRPLAFLMFDIDHFKKINDTYGHTRGDKILKALARLLRRTVRGPDTVCRYGGDEFLIMLPETRLNGARKVAQRLMNRLRRRPLANGIYVTVTGGISIYPRDGQTLDELIQAADEYLYEAKERGRERIVYGIQKKRDLELFEVTG